MIALILLLVLCLFLTYIVIYGIVYFFCLVFGLMFSSRLVVAVWVISGLIYSVVKKHERKQMDG